MPFRGLASTFGQFTKLWHLSIKTFAVMDDLEKPQLPQCACTECSDHQPNLCGKEAIVKAPDGTLFCADCLIAEKSGRSNSPTRSARKVPRVLPPDAGFLIFTQLERRSLATYCPDLHFATIPSKSSSQAFSNQIIPTVSLQVIEIEQATRGPMTLTT
jgi:hypothetical protein